MRAKHLLLFLLMATTAFEAIGQSEQDRIRVEGFRLTNSFIATSRGNVRYDDQNRPMSIIIVETADRGFEFNGGFLGGWLDTEDKPDGIWVWVPAGSMNVTISHEGYLPCRYEYEGGEIEAGRTYTMRLITPKKQQALPDCSVRVSSDMKGDEVYLDDSLVGHTPITIKLKQGIYLVKIKRGNYEKSETIAINKSDLDTYKPIEFRLEKRVTFDTRHPGDKVFIDGKQVGNVTRNGWSGDLSYGEHKIEAKRGNKFNEMVIVVDPVDNVDEYTMKLYSPQQHFTNKGVHFATLNFGMGLYDFGLGNSYFQKSYGFTVGSVKTVGWFVSFMTNFDFRAISSDCVSSWNYWYVDANDNGSGYFVDGNYPFYTGEQCGSRISFVGGMLLKMGSRTCLRMGAGYGLRAFAYKESGGQWVRPDNMYRNGFDLSLGLQFNNMNQTVFSFDVISTNASTIEVKIGVGACMQRK